MQPCIKMLIDKGARIDERCNDGDTAVHYAAVQGELECLKMLAKAGANLEVKDHDGETPMVRRCRLVSG